MRGSQKGGGHYLRGGGVLLANRVGAISGEGRVLIGVWVLIQGNMVSWFKIDLAGGIPIGYLQNTATT